MSSKAFNNIDLRLHGEHINLTNREGEDNRKNVSTGYSRPKSALYTSNLNIPDSKRRPFSAGNLPKSFSIQPFLAKAQLERRAPILKQSDFINRSLSIPGATDSTILFNKLVRDPIVNTKQQQKQKTSRNVSEFSSRPYMGLDNLSEVSSVDTVTSFGTKIKNRAQITKRLNEEKCIDKLEGSHLKLTKPKSRKLLEIEKGIMELMNESESKETNENDVKSPLKLSIFVPSNKDENTSSGVSSSSDIQIKSTNSPVMDYSGAQKFTRAKRNISINWFPETTPRSVRSADNEGSKLNDHKDLQGIVSFGNGHEESNKDNEDDDVSETGRLYNTELSLVEEESSQDSDLSPKLSMSVFDRYKNYEGVSDMRTSGSYSLDGNLYSKNTEGWDKCSKAFSNDRENYLQKKENLSTLYSTSNKIPLGMNENLSRKENIADEKNSSLYCDGDIERKFKELENKYKIDSSRQTFDHTKSLETGYGFDSDGGLRRAWTSLENVVTKDEPTELAGNVKRNNDSSEKSQEVQSNPLYKYYRSSTALVGVKDFKYSSNIDSSRLKINQSSNEKKSNECSTPTISHLSNLTDGIPDIIIDYANGKAAIRSPENVNEDKDYTSIVQDTTNRESINKNELEKRANSVEHTEEYPDYLQSNEARQYTSKVIEDYKREIESIDSVHILALKSIRDENEDSFTITNYKKMLANSEIAGSGNQTTEKDSLNKDITKFVDEYKTYKLGGYKATVDANVDVINKAESDLEDVDKRSQTQSSDSKTKKKIKKKSRSSSFRIRNCSESSDCGSKKKIKPETRRLAKSAPCKKDGNNRVRFKPQKIVLSKSSNSLNSKMYTDKDNEIISWMATKVSTSDETSSNDINDTPTPDLIKEKSYGFKTPNDNEKSKSHEAEEKIEAVIRGEHEKNKFTTDSKEKDYKIKQTMSKEQNKTKEVSFEVDKYTPSISDDFSLNDWVGNDTDGNELGDLIDDDHMVSNIYSVLKEIEQTGSSMISGGGDKIDVEISVKDESRSAEYRDILSYLENVENKANDEISSLSHTQPPFSLKVEELMELGKGELAHRAVACALAAGKAGAAAARLRGALVNAANRATARIKSERLISRQKVNAATQQSALTIARHQKFIEQLINEKKALAERIEKLVAAVESAEARSARAARASAERLQLELRNQRQRLSQAHQREKQTWLKQHTQKIKDMTIKGLESEIRELEDKHLAQKSGIQRESEERMLEEREKHAREIRILKESSTRHLEDELDRERLLAAERMEQKRVEWESALASASERAGAEGREAARTARKEAEQWKLAKERELEERRRQLEEQAEEKRAALLTEAGQAKEKFTKEFEKFKEEYKKKQNDLMRDKEMEVRAISRRERDREIEKAIESMEAEAEEGRKEMQESIRRIKAKYESDMKVLEDAEQSAMQRCKEARELLRETQELCAQQQITITQLEGKLRQADELRAQTIAEMEISMRTAEMKNREEVEEIKGQLLNLQLQHKDEMHQLYAKVKVAVSKKDDALTAARRDATTLRDRCLRLEARLAT